MTTYLRVKNLEKHQHYKDRRPPWIKLHAEVLDDYAFACLQDASKAHLMLIWVLASRMDNRIPNDATWIGRKINATDAVDVDALVSSGFLETCDAAGNPVHDASAALAGGKQPAMPETEGETEGETEKHLGADAPAESEDERAAREKQEAEAHAEAERQATITRVLTHYQSRHPRTRPDTESSRTKVGARLREFSEADLCRAIDGNARDRWHQQNKKHEIEYLFRNRAKVEQALALADEQDAQAVASGATNGATPDRAAVLWDLAKQYGLLHWNANAGEYEARIARAAADPRVRNPEGLRETVFRVKLWELGEVREDRWGQKEIRERLGVGSGPAPLGQVA